MSNPVAYLAGTWKQIDQNNIDKQLEAQGLGWAKRKIAVNLTTTVTFSFPDDKTFKVDFSTKVMSGKEEFKIGENNKHKNFEGTDVESELFIEDGVLVMITKGNACGPIKTVRRLTGDQLVISTTVVEKNVTGTRTFKKEK